LGAFSWGPSKKMAFFGGFAWEAPFGPLPNLVAPSQRPNNGPRPHNPGFLANRAARNFLNKIGPPERESRFWPGDGNSLDPCGVVRLLVGPVQHPKGPESSVARRALDLGGEERRCPRHVRRRSSTQWSIMRGIKPFSPRGNSWPERGSGWRRDPASTTKSMQENPPGWINREASSTGGCGGSRGRLLRPPYQGRKDFASAQMPNSRGQIHCCHWDLGKIPWGVVESSAGWIHARQASELWGERATPEGIRLIGSTGMVGWRDASTKGKPEWESRTDFASAWGNPGRWNHKERLEEAAGGRVFPSSRPAQGRCKSA